jgi:hypothetical protein
MNRMTIAIGAIFAVNAAAQTPASAPWAELETKRDKFSSVHQEFDFSRTNTTASGIQPVKRKLVLDMSGHQWRETAVTSSGDQIRIFDGTDLFRIEGGDEFVRTKPRHKTDDPLPDPYGYVDIDWAKALEGNDAPKMTPHVPTRRGGFQPTS